MSKEVNLAGAIERFRGYIGIRKEPKKDKRPDGAAAAPYKVEPNPSINQGK